MTLTYCSSFGVNARFSVLAGKAVAEGRNGDADGFLAAAEVPKQVFCCLFGSGQLVFQNIVPGIEITLGTLADDILSLCDKPFGKVMPADLYHYDIIRTDNSTGFDLPYHTHDCHLAVRNAVDDRKQISSAATMQMMPMTVRLPIP